MRFFQHRSPCFRTYANHELFPRRTTTHVTIYHEDEGAHHFDFRDALGIGKNFTDSFSSFFAIGHEVSCSRIRRSPSSARELMAHGTRQNLRQSMTGSTRCHSLP